MSEPNPYESPGPIDNAKADSSDAGTMTGTAVIDVTTYVRAFRVHGRNVVARVFLAFAAIGAGGFSWILATWGETLGAAVAGGLCAVCLVAVIGFQPLRAWGIRRQLRQMGKEHEEVRYTATPEWLYITTEDAQVRIRWSQFVKWKEGDGLILAYQSSRFFRIIPVDQLSHGLTDAARRFLRADSSGP